MLKDNETQTTLLKEIVFEGIRVSSIFLIYNFISRKQNFHYLKTKMSFFSFQNIAVDKRVIMMIGKEINVCLCVKNKINIIITLSSTKIN